VGSSQQFRRSIALKGSFASSGLRTPPRGFSCNYACTVRSRRAFVDVASNLTSVAAELARLLLIVSE
jgi:hypothetical protein